MTIKMNRFYLGATLMTISIIGTLMLFILNIFTTSINYKYSIAIDSGSTHSRVILFKWKANKLNNTGIIEEVQSCKVNSGISSFIGLELDNVANKLIDCIHNVSQSIEHEDLFIYLAATAGMRVLNLTDPETAAKILQKIQKEFDLAGLKSKKISIITGKEEGLFAWIAANYLSGTLFQHWHNVSYPIYGILDMGGSSIQIAYPVDFDDKSQIQNLTPIKLFGHNYYVNTFSNLCFGAEQTLNRYLKLLIWKHQSDSNQIQVPCFPKGFKTSISNFKVYNNICTEQKNQNPNIIHKEYELIGISRMDECLQVISELLDRNRCQKNFQICFEEMLENKRNPFYAISAFYHVTKVLELNKTENISRQQYLEKSKHLCSMSEERLKDKLQSFGYSPSICFKLSYIISVLDNIYKFDEQTWPNLKFVQNVNNSYLGWITGLMINETISVPSEDDSKSLIDIGIYFPIIASFIFIFVLGIFMIMIHCKKTKEPNGNSKTQPNTEKV